MANPGRSDPPDEPEAIVCPMCAAANHDEDTGEPVYAPDLAFCSALCASVYDGVLLAESAGRGFNFLRKSIDSPDALS